MSVALLKNTGGDDPRFPLREAIQAAAEAQADLDRHQQAAGKARELVRRSQAAVEAAAAAVTEASEQDATALVDAIVSGNSSSSAGAVRRARAAEADKRDEVVAAKAAYDRLRVDVSGIAVEAERAQRAVDAAIGGVLQPTARRLLDEARNLRLEFLRRVYAVDTMRAFLPTDLVEEKQRLLTFIAPELMTASSIVQRDWQTAIEALRANADVPVPEH